MGVFKLGTMTLGSVFKKPETKMYPVEIAEPPTGLKGKIICDVNDCILCGMCQNACTCNCITVDKPARTWSINRFSCVQCGYCITKCPKKCLSMDPHYASVSSEKQITTCSIPEQPKPEKAVEA